MTSAEVDGTVSAMPQDHALWMLTKYAEEAREVARMTGQWAEKAREAGATWEQIGDALGISKQAAQQRYGKQS